MNKRKWKKSSVRVRNINALMDCLVVSRGVWCEPFGKFINDAWVYSQQFRTLLNYIARGYFYYPELTEGGAE